MRRIALLLITCAILALIPALSVSAATITVTTTLDEFNTGAGCSLREAIRAANLDSAVGGCVAGQGADTITLPPGTYTLTIVGGDETGGRTGDLDISSELTIAGAGATTTIIDGGALDHVFQVHDDNESVEGNLQLSGVTIRNGSDTEGGGIENEGTVTLVDSIVANNIATSLGGGIYNRGTLTLRNSTVTSNNASDVNSDGGGIFNHTTGTITLIDSTVDNNRAASGGGIENRGTLSITRSTLYSNVATTSGGGGLSNSGSTTTATLSNTTISGNTTETGAAGIHNRGGGTLSLRNVTLANNTATAATNTTTGGLFNETGTANLRNTILAGNTAAGAPADCLRTVTSEGYNLIGNTTGCTVAGDTATNVVGANPMLAPLTNNGGRTSTHALLPGSAAIDAGNPAEPGSGGNACEETDQRGIERPQDGNADNTARCDIGAYERLPNEPVGPTATPTMTVSPTMTATPTATATVSPTATTTPGPIYLPLVVKP